MIYSIRISIRTALSLRGQSPLGSAEKWTRTKSPSTREGLLEPAWRDWEVLGSILLHESTHYRNLVAPFLGSETDDLAYGPYNCRRMDKANALHNADSYAWMALEYY